MDAKFAELEKVVSQVVKRIASLKKENATLKILAENRDGNGNGSSGKFQKLEEENKRLLAERKELRKRVRSIIRDIDRVKW